MPKVLNTRERLIESARFLFWERGFAGTSMADLLAHSGVYSGSFYHFFESKEALLRTVLEGYLHALRPMVIDPAFARTEEPVERIFAILEGYRGRVLQTDCQYGCPLGRLALEIDPENRPAHRLIATSFILVPSAVLLGASRLNWLARRPWLLMLLGPVLFVACFGGICTLAFRLIGA